MPSGIMDQRHLSFFSEELCFPTERQVGFWKPESMSDHCGTEGLPLMSGSKSVSSSPLEKLNPTNGANAVGSLDLPQSYIFKDQKSRLSFDNRLMGRETIADLSSAPWKAEFGSHSDISVKAAALFSERNPNGFHYENGHFSNSLFEMFDKKLRITSSSALLGQSIDTVDSNYAEEEPFESMEEIEAQTIGNLLPDDDDLLSGVIDDIGYINRPNNGDDIDDDIFCTGGGMELEADDNVNGNKGVLNINGPFVGEHPFGEHPSRTLFVRNINSNVEDSELKSLFEQYGDIRTLYTACKHRGFVMISYYDIRAARNAMKALQNKPLRRRRLDIHYSIPKDNPSEKDINQGTLVIFNLDSSVSNDELRQIFGVYGEIKEIRETPHKNHHKFIEFYDVRAAESALRALNRSDIAGKKIKLEPSRPGGSRRLTQPLPPELEQEDLLGHKQGSPSQSPSGCFGSVPLNGLESGAIQGLHSSVRTPISSFLETAFPGISSSISQTLSSPVGIASINNHNNHSVHSELSHSLGQMNLGFHGLPGFHPQSLPEHHNGITNGITNGIAYNSNAMSATGSNINVRPSEGMDNRIFHKVGSGSLNGHSFDHNEGAFAMSGSGSCPLHGHQYMWNNSSAAFPHHPAPPILWPNSPSILNNITSHPPPQMHGIPRAPSHVLNSALPLPNHHVGSAPTVNPSLWDRRHTYPSESADAPAFHPASLGNIAFPGSPQLHPLEMATRNIFPHAGGNNCMDPIVSPAHVGIPSPQQRNHMFHGRNPLIPMPSSFDGSSDRLRSRRSDSTANQADNKKQYELDIERIVRGEDSRTTLMIKNIPNKYTSKMLLAAIDENHRGTYDFIYLPIDFKNKCNVGYAFINMVDPQHIIPFYQTFNGKKWEKFNSEKVASLAYARIQGKAALIAHFQNSSLMNEDKRCRPILFHSDGPNAGDQEPFPMGPNIRSRSGRARTSTNEESQQENSLASANEEASCSGTETASASTKDLE
ncbi:protein MEI2-like 4 isoform X2 [Ananas comosus]|uniref:Protein MEI2-like 4 isoform X2 n=1 Tax=Ananas comosus TaxID=4615 RepID=A0A6P5GZZ8_ANACO|nr:protein MEI2-like 4 isoform X2 [Ananas comosus]